MLTSLIFLAATQPKNKMPQRFYKLLAAAIARDTEGRGIDLFRSSSQEGVVYYITNPVSVQDAEHVTLKDLRGIITTRRESTTFTNLHIARAPRDKTRKKLESVLAVALQNNQLARYIGGAAQFKVFKVEGKGATYRSLFVCPLGETKADTAIFDINEDGSVGRPLRGY